MATVNIYAANPTLSDITQDTYTVKAGQVTKLAVDDVAHATAVEDLVKAGCAVASADFSTTIHSNTELAEMGAHLLESMIRAVESAGADAHGQAGL